MQKLLAYFSNYHTGEPDVEVQGLHDTLGEGGFGGFYAPNNRTHSIWDYFGSSMSSYSSALVRRPDVQFFNLRKVEGEHLCGNILILNLDWCQHGPGDNHSYGPC